MLRIVVAGAAAAILLAISGFGFAASQESHDSFCSSCHTQPESTFYQRSQAAQPVDLATAHKVKETRCIDCHSGGGIFGRMQAELLGAHNALAFYSGTAVQPAKLTYAIGDINCLKCHQQVTASQTMNNHYHVFLSRWQASDPNAAHCVSCHGGHSTNGSADLAYLNQESTSKVCETCHSVLGAGG